MPTRARWHDAVAAVSALGNGAHGEFGEVLVWCLLLQDLYGCPCLFWGTPKILLQRTKRNYSFSDGHDKAPHETIEQTSAMTKLRTETMDKTSAMSELLPPLWRDNFTVKKMKISQPSCS
jgi:hypothetical protein